MKFADSPRKFRPYVGLLKYAAAGVIAATLAACGGTSGDTGPAGSTGSAGAPGKDGTNGVNTVAQVIVRSNKAASTIEAAANWKKLQPQITITKATIVDKPVIEFTVKDPDGNAIIGLANDSQAATAVVHSYTNVVFTLAKLVPGATSSQPSKWVSYLVTRPATVAEKTTVAATAACNNTPTTAATWCGTWPTSDAQGTLQDLGNGSYKYTFYRDVTQAKVIVASLPDTANGLNLKKDLGDLTFDATATHRVGIQIGGAAPGTGANMVDKASATGLLPVASGAPVSVSMVNTGNAWLDFRPDGAAVTATRQVVKMESCNDCHQGKVLAHGSRKDPNYCVTCHTDQVRYSINQEASTLAGSNGLILNGTTAATTSVVDGRSLGDFPNMVHKIHMGAELVKQGYFFVANNGGKFNEVKYSQDQRNCTKCHDGSATAVNKTANGDNWKTVPSPMACGACHDGIKFADGTGTTVAGATTGHGGWALKGVASADPALCSSCHDATSIAFVHTPVSPANPLNALDVPTSAGGNNNTNAAAIAPNSTNKPVGAITVTYDVKSVARNASKQPVIVFKMLQDGVAVPFNTFATTAVSAATGQKELWDKFMGAPSVYFVFAVPQDGIAAPADFNASVSGYLRSIWNGTATGTGAGTLVGPDASGYYTATLTGVVVPDSAKMLTGGLGYTYGVLTTLPLTQTNLVKYPVAAAKAATGLVAGMSNMTGGLIVVAPDVQKVATGYTGRRAIVEDARCNKCHQELGVFTAESFHGGQRNDGTTCSWCHTPNRASSGWSADSTNFVHAIHAASKRVDKFTWHAASTAEGFWGIGYPGVLKNCEACHLPGTYDFAATASASAIANKQYRTVATGTLNKSTMTALAAFSVAPVGYLPGDATNYGSGFGFNATTGLATEAAATTLVDSPITTVCIACHDSKVARTHMTELGGSIYEPRATALGKTETCMLCHATGRVADIKVMHAK